MAPLGAAGHSRTPRTRNPGDAHRTRGTDTDRHRQRPEADGFQLVAVAVAFAEHEQCDRYRDGEHGVSGGGHAVSPPRERITSVRGGG
jgi:hypothetical protein